MRTLTTAAATGTSVRWEGGEGTIPAQGTFGSGTFTVEASFDGKTNWITLQDDAGDNLALTEKGIISFSVSECDLRAVLSGSTAATVEYDFRHNR